MNVRLPLIVALFLAMPLAHFGQSEKQIESYFKRFSEADANGDGKLTREEARVHRQDARQPQQRNARTKADPSEGDNLASLSHIPGVKISESVSPVKEVELESADGVDLSFVYRTPPGKGPHPTILFFHGGGGKSNLQGLKSNLLSQPIQTRFLEKGFITIASTRRPYWKTKDGRY